MSSASTADAARPRPAIALEAVAIVPLLAYAVLTQLDAVGNRLSGGSPVGVTELTLAAMVGCAALLIADPAARLPAGDTTGFRLIGAMFCWAVFAWTLSAHREAGLDYLIKLATALVPACCVPLLVRRRAQLHLLLWAIIGAGAISAAIMIVEARTGTRIVSTSIAATTAGFEGVARSAGGSDQNPTTAAQMLLVSTLLAAALLFAPARRFAPVLAGVAALGAAALALNGARSAVVGLAAGLALVAWSLRRRGYFPLLVVGGLAAAVAAIPFLPPTLVDRFAAIGDFGQDQTLYRRISYLRIGFDLLAQSPIWGVGPGNFPLHYVGDDYRWMPGRLPFPRELHNTYLDAAAEYGLVGFLLFAAALGSALIAARGAARSTDAAIARDGFAVGVALAGLLVACVFMPHKDMRYLWLLVAIALQSGRLAREEEPRP